MKWIKKIAATSLAKNIGMIINSLVSGDDPTVNAPSIQAVKNAIDNIEIGDGAITTNKLANKSVTKDKIADGVLPETNIITAYLTSDYTIQGDYSSNILPFAANNKVGNKLSLDTSTGKITVLKGVSYIKISGHIRIGSTPTTQDSVVVVVEIDGDDVFSTTEYITHYNQQVSIPSLLIPISDTSRNHLISLRVAGEDGEKISGDLGRINPYFCTFITVEGII